MKWNTTLLYKALLRGRSHYIVRK